MLHRCRLGLGKFDRLLSVIALALVLGTVLTVILIPVSAISIIICSTCVTVLSILASLAIALRRGRATDEKLTAILDILVEWRNEKKP